MAGQADNSGESCYRLTALIEECCGYSPYTSRGGIRFHERPQEPENALPVEYPRKSQSPGLPGVSMTNCRNKLALCLAAALGLAVGNLSAASPALDAAVKKYYAGYPNEAIGMIEPLAISGDVDAQYLLGNILYTLANSGQGNVQGDPVEWYRLAAEQDSPQAAYALGAIYNDRWLQSQRDEDARLARSYFQQALDLGEQKAQAALEKLKSNPKTASLTYTNESFSSKRPSPPASQPATKQTPQAARLSDVLAGFESSGDPAADARRLQALLNQMSGDGAVQGGDYGPDLVTLTQLLGGFESTEQLFSDLLNLFDHLEEASKLNTAPGSN
jgi:hypothetical protein